MKALVFDKSKYSWEGSKGFEKVEVPKPVLDEDKNPEDAVYVIMKVHYAGVCGSDRGIWYRQAFREQILNSLERQENSYRIIGHEFFGEVEQVGSKVKNVKLGDFVACESHVVCNTCYQCLLGEKHVCTNEKILGISHDGGFAEYAKIPADILWKTDTSKIRPEVATMQEPFGNAVHAASKVNVSGKTVAIFGLGPIGMFLILILRSLGAKTIIGVEPNPVAIHMAKLLGIDYVIPLHKIARKSSGKTYHHDMEVTQEIMNMTNGIGVDVSFEMAGFNSSVNNCLFATRRGGDIVLFGIKTGDFVFEDYNRLIIRGYTVHAVIGRKLWQTWETTRLLLEDTGNNIQEKMFNVILQEGQYTIISINDYTPQLFEDKLNKHPKILIQF